MYYGDIVGYKGGDGTLFSARLYWMLATEGTFDVERMHFETERRPSNVYSSRRYSVPRFDCKWNTSYDSWSRTSLHPRPCCMTRIRWRARCPWRRSRDRRDVQMAKAMKEETESNSLEKKDLCVCVLEGNVATAIVFIYTFFHARTMAGRWFFFCCCAR
ncbi:hypothetical protein BJV82DRAFT_631136 [Fennellomyces sp. T-0311]|nr:hypothetical protein BJV82DRAFT_631136 [Fennellomyces sp. T-0311]